MLEDMGLSSGHAIAAWWSAAWLTAVGVEHLPAGFY
jgi:hypothetical protein